ncbi:hypothetical protein [Melittangium boletus]|uniref:Roadblock/LAMTOR2 domain-containing protein n=1 Tax=Melittangium boletus DSM 14713 TaxID=1294270 RepID=A0A250I9V5_9BACT|nr:hypothetical protein [Melittangium boletus]ATB27746.1 hypothetical protein MEBOL_001191 [Melittangium boletus DSM 14713]
MDKPLPVELLEPVLTRFGVLYAVFARADGRVLLTWGDASSIPVLDEYSFVGATRDMARVYRSLERMLLPQMDVQGEHLGIRSKVCDRVVYALFFETRRFEASTPVERLRTEYAFCKSLSNAVDTALHGWASGR